LAVAGKDVSRVLRVVRMPNRGSRRTEPRCWQANRRSVCAATLAAAHGRDDGGKLGEDTEMLARRKLIGIAGALAIGLAILQPPSGAAAADGDGRAVFIATNSAGSGAAQVPTPPPRAAR
jgi:hypothetical protein